MFEIHKRIRWYAPTFHSLLQFSRHYYSTRRFSSPPIDSLIHGLLFFDLNAYSLSYLLACLFAESFTLRFLFWLHIFSHQFWAHEVLLLSEFFTNLKCYRCNKQQKKLNFQNKLGCWLIVSFFSHCYCYLMPLVSCFEALRWQWLLSRASRSIACV